MQKRAERFNVPVSLESKKAARAVRWVLPNPPSHQWLGVLGGGTPAREWGYASDPTAVPAL